VVWGERWTCAGRFLVDHLKRPLPKQPKKTFFDVGSSFDRLPSATIEDAVLWAEGAILNGADAGDGVDADVGEGATSAFADVLDLLKSSLGGSWRVEAAWCPRSYSRSGWDGRFGDKPSVRSTVPREYDSWGVHDALDRLAQAEIAALGFGCAFETWHDGIAMPVQAKVRLQAGERSGHELLEARMRLGFRSVRSIPGWVEAAAALDGLLPGVLPQGALRKTRRRKAA